jgi:hypothetical protein
MVSVLAIQSLFSYTLPMLASRNASIWKTGKDMPKSLISEALGFDAHVESTPLCHLLVI